MKDKIRSHLILFFLLLALSIAITDAQTNITLDTGFKPDINGFSFQNYGNLPQVVDLTPDELNRMFGDEVCRSTADGKCILSPPAKRWMDEANQAMKYGHCEGMAVLSEFMYFNKISPIKFGGSRAEHLAFNNTLLQREIAYWWATQVTSPGSIQKVNKSPEDVLNVLIKAFAEGKKATEWWELSLYKPDGSGGHTVTPIAVQDMGNGTAKILIYDNNYPKEIRAVEINKTANTWKYITSISPKKPPEVYSGNATTHNLEVSSLSSRLGLQKCQFCDEANTTSRQKSQSVQSGEGYIQLWLDGGAHLLITDELGRRIGFLPSGEFVNEIPDATAKNFKVQEVILNKEPMYSIPATSTTEHFNIKIDGTRLLNGSYQNLMIMGPCFDIGAKKIWLNPGETDEMNVTWSTYCDYIRVEYRTASKSKMIDLITGLKSTKADYEFVARDAKVTNKGALIVELNLNTGKFGFVTQDNSDPGKVQIMMHRVDDQGEQFYVNDGLSLQENDAVNVNFESWQGEGSAMQAEVDHSDGTTEQVTLADDPSQHDEYYTNPTETPTETTPTPTTPTTPTETTPTTPTETTPAEEVAPTEEQPTAPPSSGTVPPAPTPSTPAPTREFTLTVHLST